MSTEVQKNAAGQLPAALANLKTGLQNVQSSVRVKGGEDILKFGRDGKWVFGAENLEPEEGSIWAINPLSLQHGLVCWKIIPDGNPNKEKAELFGEEMRAPHQPLPNKDDLPVYHNTDGSVAPWVEQITFNLMCLDGEDKDEQVIYKTSSQGGLRAAKDVIDAIMKQIDDDPAHPVPVVKLSGDHYQHSTWGKTYFPIFDIVKWADMDGAAVEAPKQAEQKAKPAEEPEQAAAEEPAEEPQTAAPTPEQSGGGERRRRRRS